MIDHFLQYIFSVPLQTFTQRMDKIIETNDQLQNKTTYKLFYRDDMFFHSMYGNYGYTYFAPNRLHPTLQDDLTAWKNERNQWEIEHQQPVHGYLVQALNLCQSPSDLFLVLPDVLHSQMPQAIKKQCDYYPRTISEPDLVAFKQRHENDEQLIKENLVINLITR
jgi:hypothetical protein